MTTHIIHHNDLDGYASAGIAKAFLEKQGIHPHFIEMNYGMTLPEVFNQQDTVYMLDFSLQPFDAAMEALANSVDKFIWIDHHASSISAYKLLQQEKGLSWGYDGVRLDGYCGAELTWAWFNLPGRSLSELEGICQEAPDAIKLVGDWDTWRHAKMVDSKAPFFKMYFDTMVPEGVIEWFRVYAEESWLEGSGHAKYMEEVTAQAIHIGTSIKMFEVSESAALMKSRAFEAKLVIPAAPGVSRDSAYAEVVYSVIAANMGARGSDRFASVYQPEKHELMLGFAYENTGKVTVSLYSTNPDIDCGAIAKLCGEAGPFPGGGGHKGAAGFQTSWEFLMDKLLKLPPQ
jgi:oligoribonuclease NrnB/cAMP/cGMP phosphodiesterase (DHH superfamily)